MAAPLSQETMGATGPSPSLLMHRPVASFFSFTESPSPREAIYPATIATSDFQAGIAWIVQPVQLNKPRAHVGEVFRIHYAVDVVGVWLYRLQIKLFVRRLQSLAGRGKNHRGSEPHPENYGAGPSCTSNECSNRFDSAQRSTSNDAWSPPKCIFLPGSSCGLAFAPATGHSQGLRYSTVSKLSAI